METFKAPTGRNDEIIKVIDDLPDRCVISFFHGTIAPYALEIIRTHTLLPDDMNAVGLCSTFDEAHSYAWMKGKDTGQTPTILEVKVRKEDLGLSINKLHSGSYTSEDGTLRYYQPEIGGRGKNQIVVEQVRKGAWSLPLYGSILIREVDYRG